MRAGKPRKRGLRPLAAVAASIVVAAATAQPAMAQPWDTPSYNTPYGENGFGLYLNFVNDVDDIAAAVTYRQSGSVLDWGLRGGVADVGDDLSLFGGVDLKNQFVRATESFPLDVAWVTGAGISYVFDPEVGLFRIPFGFSLGRAIQTEDGKLTVTPYGYPKLALDVGLGDNSDTELHFEVDLGADFKFAPRWFLRFGATIGNASAIGFGIAFQ